MDYNISTKEVALLLNLNEPSLFAFLKGQAKLMYKDIPLELSPPKAAISRGRTRQFKYSEVEIFAKEFKQACTKIELQINGR